MKWTESKAIDKESEVKAGVVKSGNWYKQSGENVPQEIK